MEQQQIIQGLEGLLSRVDGIYSAYATAKADYENIYEHKKTKLSSLMAAYPGSVSARESEALASGEYAEYLKTLDEANKAYLQTYAQVKGLDIKLACYQSLNKQIIKELEQSVTQR